MAHGALTSLRSPSPVPARPPHVVIFPLPAQGHVNTMLRLAELLILRSGGNGLCVTFLNSEQNHRRLLSFTDAADRFSEHPTFRFKTISDGLPPEAPLSKDTILEMMEYLKLTARDVIADVIAPPPTSSSLPPVTCIIVDGALSFVIDLGEDIGVPVFVFRTISACGFWAYFCMPRLVEAGELPIQGEDDKDRLLTSIPAMEGFLRCRDLPTFCQVTDLSDAFFRYIEDQTIRTSQARGLILNTFDALEESMLDQIRPYCPNLYTVGPLNTHLRSIQLSTGSSPVISSGGRSSNSLWKEDRSCLRWLDMQPERSVVYVSFGSITVFKGKELTEFWHGLAASKFRFLWVMRPGSVPDQDEEDDELRAVTRERGCIVEWAPQEEVLAHPAIGGFLTHSGWNSTIESIAAGVPMVCWPYIAEQPTNSRFVSEVWKVGMDMKGSCDRRVIERMVGDLMTGRREELATTAACMAEAAAEAVSQGGSSWDSMNRLIDDIWTMASPHKRVDH
ncbi:hypothetical protein SAY87_009811 [Trapa incisa]|uniref:Glycosyltransferase n=1 Tax=Trapa incisa TaxID=236973 RepID=A0AAN7JZ16_9MYRT|nr:hypothetical protein SAY87_009811 [Trapa incisa]